MSAGRCSRVLQTGWPKTTEMHVCLCQRRPEVCGRAVAAWASSEAPPVLGLWAPLSSWSYPSSLCLSLHVASLFPSQIFRHLLLRGHLSLGLEASFSQGDLILGSLCRLYQQRPFFQIRSHSQVLVDLSFFLGKT